MLVRNSMEIDGPVEQVYALARDIYACADAMPDVKSVKVVERSPDGSRVIAEWEVMAREFRALIRWTTEDIWDDTAYTCKSSILKSDYYTYSGQCTLTDLGGRTRFESEVEIECDLPRVGSHVKNYIARKLEANVDSMLAVIKAKIEVSDAANSGLLPEAIGEASEGSTESGGLGLSQGL